MALLRHSASIKREPGIKRVDCSNAPSQRCTILLTLCGIFEQISIIALGPSILSIRVILIFILAISNFVDLSLPLTSWL